MMLSQPIGILLCNLGTPQAPTTQALRPFLREFLSDPRVVELPRFQWLPILYGFILPFRPRKSAQLYREIWSKEGSPLLVTSQKLGRAIEDRLRTEHSPGPAPELASNERVITLEVGMRYGQPSIGSALQKLQTAGCSRILVLPLYPQYSAATVASTFDAVWKELARWRVVPEIRTIRQYPTDDAYISALVSSIRELWDREGEPEKLLLSFHGIPKRYAEAADPYADQCRETARLVAAQLGTSTDRCKVSFQSVFGKEEWIRPATDQTVRELGEAGIEKLDVICPGFAVDCLETLEEINGQNRAIFLRHGGARFRYIPCLNDREDHVEMLAGLVGENLHGWVPSESAALRSCGGS